MTFVEPAFLVFLPLAALLVWGLGGRLRQAALLAASLVFYGWAHPWTVGLLVGVGLVAWGAALGRSRWPGLRRLWLGLAAVGTLGPLVAFKYLDLFATVSVGVLERLGVASTWTSLGWLLPVGLSFYTVQALAYVIDVDRGRMAARADPRDVLLFLAFFPQLVAGPIERAGHLLPQLDAPAPPTADRVAGGVSLLVWGAVQKVCVADTIAPFVDRTYALAAPSWPLVAAASVAFSVQILADFSGYTNLARGAARLLGVELVENFRHPYLATSPRDFWRRWHVSFSQWIRDYVYLPLGGSRGGALRTAAATTVAMLVSGLWHGASASFVLWGAYHAALLVGQRALGPRLPDLGRGVAVLVTYGLTLVGWTIFRETRLDRLVAYAALVPWQAPRADWVAAAALVATAGLVASPLLVGLWVGPRLAAVEGPWRWPLRTTAWTAGVLAVVSTVRVGAGEFLYFRF